MESFVIEHPIPKHQREREKEKNRRKSRLSLKKKFRPPILAIATTRGRGAAPEARKRSSVWQQCDVSRMIKNPDNLARGSGQCLVDFTNGGSDTTQHLRYLIGNWATPLIYPGSRNVGCSGRRWPPSFPAPRAKIINHTGQAAPRIHLHLSPTGLLLSTREGPPGNSDVVCDGTKKRWKINVSNPFSYNTRGKKFGYKEGYQEIESRSSRARG